MLLSPLLLVAIDRFVLPRFTRGSGRSLDEISEQQQRRSSSRASAATGRSSAACCAQGVRATVLDHDADMVEAARVFGYKVFYGDATRLDLLRTAGAEKARILVVAVDDQGAVAAHRRPGARALPAPGAGGARARRDALERAARPRRDARRARAVRVQPAQRPHGAGAAGQPPHEARRQAMRFRRHNLELFEQMYPNRKDRAKLIAVVKQGRRSSSRSRWRASARMPARRRSACPSRCRCGRCGRSSASCAR
jgi:glutathione-regulated potassium-efflux system ancillary protein KefC